MSKDKKAVVEEGTVRIGKDLKVYRCSNGGWKVVKRNIPGAFAVIDLFKANKKFRELVDKKNPNFLKGQLSSSGVVQGARINVLPNGKKLDGAFSLFSPDLSVHDELSHTQWDVVYRNPNGNLAYHYTLDKKKKSVGEKYQKVRRFEKAYPQLRKKVLDSLNDGTDFMALPMFTLFETHMRIGNEIYFKAHGHKGLTTLKKEDIKISGSQVRFSFFGKDGVPQNIVKGFPEVYLLRLKKLLAKKKKGEFVFTRGGGTIVKEEDFKKKFKEYTGEDFYPHIVRSYFATRETEYFLNSHKGFSKDEARELLNGVAEELGHKKISKKTGEWVDSYTVTIGHYIDPRLASKLQAVLRGKEKGEKKKCN